MTDLALFAGLVLLAVACGAAGRLLVRELQGRRRDAVVLRLVATFGPAIARAQEQPRELLAWEPLARAARRLFPESFRELDAAFGGRFPFTRDEIQAAHARWTADWLAWERTHDFDYKLKAATLERELESEGAADSPVGRAQLEAIEREKLERYQQRYEEYIKVAKALQKLEQESEKDYRPAPAAAAERERARQPRAGVGPREH